MTKKILVTFYNGDQKASVKLDLGPDMRSELERCMDDILYRLSYRFRINCSKKSMKDLLDFNYDDIMAYYAIKKHLDEMDKDEHGQM